MASSALQDAPPFVGHSPDQERPLGGYTALMGVFLSLCGAFAAWFRASDRELPERVPPGDLALIAVATHKLSRLIAKDRVTSSFRAPFTRFEGDAGPSEVDEAARGHGLRRAVGELLICPYLPRSLGELRVSQRLDGVTAADPLARLRVAVLTGADVLQIAYKQAEEQL